MSGFNQTNKRYLYLKTQNAKFDEYEGKRR